MRFLDLRCAAIAAAILALSLSCTFLDNILPQAGGQTAADSEYLDGDTPIALEDLADPRVEGSLVLRSVEMTVQTAFPGGNPERIFISVDASGNQRIEMTTPVPEDSTITPESPDWNVYEIFMVGGAAYTRMGRTGSADPAPVENEALRKILYAPTGPGMWLILLPEDSFSPAGQETKGGFQAERYAVSGSLDDALIQGEFWVDTETGALVGASLSLAEGLFRPVESGTGGWVTIDFSVEKADVPYITVP